MKHPALKAEAITAVFAICVLAGMCKGSGNDSGLRHNLNLRQDATAILNENRDAKPTVEQARSALVKMLENELGKELEGLDVDTAKKVIAFLTTKDRVTALKTETPRYWKDKGYTYVGDWAIVIDESRFFVVVPQKTEIIWIHGDLTPRNGQWQASVTKISVGNKGFSKV